MKIYNNNTKATEHFKHRELFTKSDDFVLKYHELSDATLKGLEFIRTYYNEPLIITSTYRTPAGNAEAGGASQSFHLQGKAIDFQAQNDEISFVNRFKADYTKKDSELKNHLDYFGVKGVFFYPTFIHIDSRTTANSVDYRQSLGAGISGIIALVLIFFSLR